MPDYLPRRDEEFSDWFDNFIENTRRQATQLGLTEAELAEIESHRQLWRQALAEWRTAKKRSGDAAGQKKRARLENERMIRKYVRIIQAHPATTNQQRRELGIRLKPEEDRWQQRGQGITRMGHNMEPLGY